MNFRIGVDGGGTKTDCVLVNANGAVVAQNSAPGCNPSLVGPERARRVLLDALQTLLTATPRSPDIEGAGSPSSAATVDRVLLCMAGSESFWRETAARLEGYGRVETMPDSLPVLELATDGGPGVAVHAGTGSFVTARARDGSLHYAGGLGWRFGDPAGGYDLGRRGIALALLELQGWAPRTNLADQLCEHTGLADYAANSRWFFRGEEAGATIAAFAPRVVELASRGCAPAQQVIAGSINELATLVNTVCVRLFPDATAQTPVFCGVSGALLNQPPCWFALRSTVAARAWPIQLRPVTGSPIEGVRRLLQKMP